MTVLVSVDRYQVITGDTDSATAQVETAIADAGRLLADDLGRPDILYGTHTETLQLWPHPQTGVAQAYPSVVPVHSESTGLEVRDDVIYGASPDSSPSLDAYGAPPTAATLTYTAGWKADGTGRAKTPGLVERDLAWCAHALLRPSATTRIPAGATQVKLGDAAVTFASPQTPGAAGIVWSKATMRWKRRTP